MPNPYERELDIIAATQKLTHAEVVEVRSDIKILLIEVSGLKVKAGIWGGIAGIIPTLAAIALYFVQKKM